MMDRSFLRRLERIVGAEYVSSGRADAEVYCYDASLAIGAPDAVVRPASTEQTAAVVRAASEAGVPYVPRGFGTNLSGGSVAPDGGLVIELARLNRVLVIRPESRYAVAEAGVTNLELQNALAPLGFYYAPDPASQKVATLGGNLGENSGGPHCLKYGVTGNHVLGMTCVLPGGQVVRTGGPALDPPGYDLRGVLVGSEGTLGVVTELVVRILPKPEAVVTLLAIYDDNADAARSVSEIIAAGIVPATLEMMDATVMRAVEESMPCGYPLDAAAVLIVEVDGPAAGLRRQADQIAELCTRNGCRQVRTAKDASQRDLLWAGRRGAFGAIARLAPNYLVADCTVPRTRLPEALARVAAIAQQHDLAYGNVFHAGDGNLHPLLLFDSRDADQVRRVHQAGKEIMEACVALGGTITGEHGVGVEKSEAMRMVFSEDDLEVQRRLRRAFDPDGLLNPRKILPPPVAAQEPPEPAPQESPHDGQLVPADAAEACEMVRRALVDQAALLPLGSGLRSDFGNHGQRPLIPVRSTRLSGVVEYDPANQVIAVGAGTSLDSLQDVLLEHGQWLAVRPPLGGENTVGGVAALGACGPERLRYGSPRDLVLGLKFVSGTGRLISAGGRVVKNVAGYDLTRLLVGSAGTLGLITELTLRVSSIPPRCLALVASGSLEKCKTAATGLLRCQLEPTFVVAVPEEAATRAEGKAPWQLMAGFEGFEETVTAQVEGCQALVAGEGLTVGERREYSPRQGVFEKRFEALFESPFLVRIDLPLEKAAAFFLKQQDGLSARAALVDLGCGRILAAASDLTPDGWTRLAQAAADAGGHAIVEKSPTSFRQEHDVFGPPRADWPIMHRVKAALDPQNVFAPGRLPGRKYS